MPMIIFKDKLNDQNISLAFNCEYDDNTLKIEDGSHFDCGTFKTKIKEAISNFNGDLFEEYKKNNNDIACLAILNYLTDKIPDLYSIKFEDKSEESIYYKDELKND